MSLYWLMIIIVGLDRSCVVPRYR